MTVVGAVYRPPGSENVISHITEYIAQNRIYTYKMIITSDLNTPCIDWALLTSTGRGKVVCDSLIIMAVSFYLTSG